MRDILGVSLQVGQTVVFNPPRYKGLIIGVITKLTPKMVAIEYPTKYGKEITHMFPADVVVVNNPVA